MMVKSKSFSSIIIALLIFAVLMLPARFFQYYSLSLFKLDSNINVNYMNVVDLMILGIAFLCLLSSPVCISLKNQGIVCCFYIIITVCCFIGLTFSGNIEFSGELFSKALIVVCSFIVAKYISNKFSASDIDRFYIFILIVLVFSSFFLKNYLEYGTTRRTGTIGFGSNETAMFACSLLLISLFKPKLHFIVRLAIFILCFACLFIIASRRGLFIALVLLFAKVAFIAIKPNKKFNSKTIINVGLVLFVLVILFTILREKITSFVTTSSLFYRFKYSLNETSSFSLSDRFIIFSDSFDYLNDHFLFGSFGCDKLFGQGNLIHAHNIFIQIFVTYGFIFGTIICMYFLYTFANTIKYFIRINVNDSNLFSPVSFLFMFFICEQVGYLLWNPKAFFWILITTFYTNIHINKNKKDHSVRKDY